MTKSVKNIIRVTASVTGVSESDLLSPSRKGPIARARFVAMKAAKEATNANLSRIGSAMNRDRASIRHGIKRAAELIAEDPEHSMNFHEIMVIAARHQPHLDCGAYQQIDRNALV